MKKYAVYMNGWRNGMRHAIKPTNNVKKQGASLDTYKKKKKIIQKHSQLRVWFDRFKRRHNLHSIRFSGGAARAGTQAAKEFLQLPNFSWNFTKK